MKPKLILTFGLDHFDGAGHRAISLLIEGFSFSCGKVHLDGHLREKLFQRKVAFQREAPALA